MDIATRPWAEDTELQIVRGWNVDGHEVLLARDRFKQAKGREAEAWSELLLLCAGDYMRPGDDPCQGGLHCAAKADVSRLAIAEQRLKHGPVWREIGLTGALLDIMARTAQGEWFGQYDGDDASRITLRQAATVIGVPPGHARAAALDLYAERKLDMDGEYLCAFDERFRLPHALAWAVNRYCARPLGEHAGTVGIEAIREVEKRMQTALRIKDPAEAFGRHWPDMDPAAVALLFTRLSAMFQNCVENPVMHNRVFVSKRIDRPKQWMDGIATQHPGLRADVLEEFARQCILLVRGRAQLLLAADPRKKKPVQPDENVTARTLHTTVADFREWTREAAEDAEREEKKRALRPKPD
ncbi:MAG: hypothetical protein RLZZ324_321 [Candidatus Parcubacteria bacterium]|jgi:hypothetical protein